MMVTELLPLPDCTTGYGYSPPARKLASLPLVAIRFGSARLWNRPFVCSARTTPPRPSFELKTNRLRKSLKTSPFSASNSGEGELPAGRCGPTQSFLKLLAKKLAPSSWTALRLTSAKRTRSMTWLDATPSCCFSRLTTFSSFSTYPAATLAAFSTTYWLDTVPEMTTSLPLPMIEIGSPGNSCLTCSTSALRSRRTFTS